MMRREWLFAAGLIVAAGGYALLVSAMLIADVLATTPNHLLAALREPAVHAAAKLSLLSSALATLLALWVAVPTGYLLARVTFPGRAILALVVDIPLVLPPTVVGLSLLLLAQTSFGRVLSGGAQVAYAVPAVVVAQFVVTAAFAAEASRLTFARRGSRVEDLARSLGCSRGQAFWRVTLPEAAPQLASVAALSWARALGEFGPVLVFAGAARFRTETLPATVYLKLSAGELESAVAVALILVVLSLTILAAARLAAPRS